MKIHKNYLLVTSIFTSLLGLVLIYVASVNIEPHRTAIGDITADMEGRKVSIAGRLIEKQEHKNGHLFLTIADDKAKLQVPLFADFMKGLNQIGITKDDFRLDGNISVRGVLENYKGTLQIVPKGLDDVKIMGD